MNYKTLIKWSSLVTWFGLFGCGNQKTIMKFPCTPEFSVVERFHKGTFVTASHYEKFLLLGGIEVLIAGDNYRAHTPPHIERKILGDPIEPAAPHQLVNNLYLFNDLQPAQAEAVVKCFESNYDAFETRYKKSKSRERSQSFDIQDTFVFWYAKHTDLRPKFSAPDGTYLTVGSSGNIYHATPNEKGKHDLETVGQVHAGPGGVSKIDLDLSKVSPDLDPNAFLNNEKTLKQYYMGN